MCCELASGWRNFHILFKPHVHQMEREKKRYQLPYGYTCPIYFFFWIPFSCFWFWWWFWLITISKRFGPFNFLFFSTHSSSRWRCREVQWILDTPYMHAQCLRACSLCSFDDFSNFYGLSSGVVISTRKWIWLDWKWTVECKWPKNDLCAFCHSSFAIKCNGKR